MGFIAGALIVGSALIQADKARDAAKAEMTASEKATEYLRLGRRGYEETIDQASTDLDAAYDLGLQRMEQGMAEMQSGYQRARGDLGGARQALESGYQRASKDLDTARGDIETGISQFDPYSQAGTRALVEYEKMLNKPSSIFDSPIYSSKQAQLTKLLSARAAQTGRLGSSADILSTFAPAYTQLMEQEYENALGRYQPLIQYGYGAAGAQAGLYQSMAGIAGQRAAMSQALGQSLSGIYGQEASLSANLGNRMMAGRTYQSGLDVERGQKKAALEASRGAMRYTHATNLANMAMGEGAIEANYFNQIGSIYGGLADQAGELAGQFASKLAGGMN